MSKYILCGLLVTFNVNAGENIIGEMLDTYAKQPIIVIVQPNNQLQPIINPPLVTSGNPNWGEVDFMLPEVSQIEMETK